MGVFTDSSLRTFSGQQTSKVGDLSHPQMRVTQKLVPCSEHFKSISNKTSYLADWNFQPRINPNSLAYHSARNGGTTVFLYV